MAELEVIAPDGSTSIHRLGRMAVLGRHPECEIVLTDPMSSRYHCKIFQDTDGEFFIEDNGSANGTMLNGVEMVRKQRYPFRSTDLAMIGYTRLKLLQSKPVSGQRMVAPASFDPNQSLVCVREDVNEDEPMFDYTIAATGAPLTKDEESSSDLQQLRRVTERLKLLVEMGQIIGTTLDARKVLRTCLDKLFDVFPQAERGFIILADHEGKIPSQIVPETEAEESTRRAGAVSVSKIRTPESGENAVQISRTVINRVREHRQAVLLRDTASEMDIGMSLVNAQIRSVMCTPLLAGKEDLGVLYLDTKDARRHFGPEDVDLLNALSGQITVVLKNAELAQNAAQEAATRENLQRFLSPQLVDQIIKKEMSVELGGSTKHGTVFFSDIVGFTRMASKMRPQDVVALLNRYFQVMQDIIFQRSGTVDKTGGDAIMAFWGVLVDTPDASWHACTASIEMQNALFLFNQELALDEKIVKPPTPLGHGIGLNTGEFVAGNIGGDKKIEFTVIGNSVNLAQRLESLAGRGQVFIGAGTYEEVKDRVFVFRMPDCPVKNVDKPIAVYSVRGVVPPDAQNDPAATNATPVTTKLTSGIQDMIVSLPCRLEIGGQAPTAGLVVRIRLNSNTRNGFLELYSERPLQAGLAVKLSWQLQEKPRLPMMACSVETTWQEPSAEAQDPKEKLLDRGNRLRKLVLKATKVPDEIFEFRPGVMLESDLEEPEQNVRA